MEQEMSGHNSVASELAQLNPLIESLRQDIDNIKDKLVYIEDK